MNQPYGINHDGDFYRYEAQANWEADNTGTPVWHIRIVEVSQVEDDDGNSTYYAKEVTEVVSDQQRINRAVDITNYRPGLGAALKDRNWARLSGRPWLYVRRRQAHVAPLAPPMVHQCGNTTDDALMARMAARIDRCPALSITDLQEARKAVKPAHHHDPTVLAAAITAKHLQNATIRQVI